MNGDTMQTMTISQTYRENVEREFFPISETQRIVLKRGSFVPEPDNYNSIAFTVDYGAGSYRATYLGGNTTGEDALMAYVTEFMLRSPLRDDVTAVERALSILGWTAKVTQGMNYRTPYLLVVAAHTADSQNTGIPGLLAADVSEYSQEWDTYFRGESALLTLFTEDGGTWSEADIPDVPPYVVHSTKEDMIREGVEEYITELRAWDAL